MQVAVTGQGIGPTQLGTICVAGNYVVNDVAGPRDEGTMVRVRVVLQGSGAFPDPIYPPTGYVDTPVVGMAWCATKVPVPACTDTGTNLTVYAWSFPTGQTPANPPDDTQDFVGLTSAPSGTLTCCDGCGSGATVHGAELGRMADGVALRITVPDGPAAGHHAAGPVAQLAWRATVGGVVCDISACPTSGLAVQADGRPVAVAGVEFEPLSALLPGAAFGAAGDVVVTQA
jgi:hypothetical protein